MTADPAALARDLLAWYDRHGRRLPWRVTGGARADPYRVWLSEIMLQQTTVATVKPRYEAFLDRWPTLPDLARADLEAVLHEWQGLGYYARARNLHACAVAVAERHGGTFPATEADLLTLPGIGAYTAAAIAAIAFGRRATPVDGNVLRVTARLFGITTPLPGGRAVMAAAAARLTPAERSGDFAQAMMDLGATVCTPRRPACGICPWQGGCAARRQGVAAELPRKEEKGAKPTRYGVVFWAERPGQGVLIRRRPPRGLLGGMMEFPSTDWRPEPWRVGEAVTAAPVAATWRPLPGSVRHTFTHFHLELTVVTAETEDPPGDGRWCAPDDFAGEAFPTLMRKVIAHVARAIGSSGPVDRTAAAAPGGEPLDAVAAGATAGRRRPSNTSRRR